MTSTKKYVGMDVHKESISIAVMNSVGKIVMECVLETKGSMILQFIDGLRGDVHATFEEGTWAAWLYDLLRPHVSEVLVCNPRKNALLKDGSKSDRIDARKLAELLRGNHLKPVYHGEQGLRTLKELARSYLNIGKDVTRVMNRLKALYRSWGIACAAPKCMHDDTAWNGWARSAKPASGNAPNTATSSWMPYVCCTSRYAGICCWKARSTRHGDCLA
jgi:transposase